MANSQRHCRVPDLQSSVRSSRVRAVQSAFGVDLRVVFPVDEDRELVPCHGSLVTLRPLLTREAACLCATADSPPRVVDLLDDAMGVVMALQLNSGKFAWRDTVRPESGQSSTRGWNPAPRAVAVKAASCGGFPRTRRPAAEAGGGRCRGQPSDAAADNRDLAIEKGRRLGDAIQGVDQVQGAVCWS